MSKGAAEAWFNNEILAGLMRIQVLNLSFSPSVDTIKPLAATWVDVLWRYNIDWCYELDVERIQKAFQRVMVSMDRFPTPAQFMYYLPEREYRDMALPKPVVSDEMRSEVLANVRAELRRILA
jgi:hypothetical protein